MIDKKAVHRERQSRRLKVGYKPHRAVDGDLPTDEERLYLALDGTRDSQELLDHFQYSCCIRVIDGKWIGPYKSRRKARVAANRYKRFFNKPKLFQSIAWPYIVAGENPGTENSFDTVYLR